MQQPLLILPSSWSCSASSIQIFGYTNTNKSIFVKFPILCTKIHNQDSPRDLSNEKYSLDSIISRGCFEHSNVDPHGPLYAMWKYKKITPYFWIRIDNYKPIAGKYAKCDLNISCGEEDIIPIDNEQMPEEKLLFWDIETYVDNKDVFCSASNPKEYIYMISVITVHGNKRMSYLITTCNVPFSNDYSVIKVSDEKSLLIRFFAIYQSFNPDTDIYFNGDSFDLPYLLARCELNKLPIPPISKISNYVPEKYVTKNFMNQNVLTINTPGINRIDLMLVFKKFFPYPELENYKLDTISNKFLEKGKLPITLDEMIDAVDTQDSQLLDKLAQYSMIDSLRMVELWQELELSNELRLTCSILKITIDDLLHIDYDSIVDKFMYNIFSEPINNFCNSKLLIPLDKGIYTDVYIYRSSILYMQIMRLSSNETVRKLAEDLIYIPDELVCKIFYSKYIYNDELNKILLDEIQKIKHNIIGMSETQIFSKSGDYNVSKISTAKLLLVASNDSNMILQNDKFVKKGYNNVCNPECEYIKLIVEDYLLSIHNNVEPDGTNCIADFNVKNLTLTRKINNASNLSPDKLEYKLISQYDRGYTPGITLKYIMSTSGPILCDKMTIDLKIDYEFYTKMAEKHLQTLASFIIYR